MTARIFSLLDRGTDSWGCGDFGASRGGRTHKGCDLVAEEGQLIASPVSGVVTKIGWPYSAKDKSHIRYVQVSDGKYNWRVFYVHPSVRVGQNVRAGDVIGTAQDLSCFYKGMKNHVHLEIKTGRKEWLDPTLSIALARNAGLK